MLLVEDDEDVEVLVRLRGERDGTYVVAASAGDATTALAAYRSLDPRPDVVLMDYRLSGDDGLEVSRAIRAIDPDQPIVLLTSHLDPELDDAAAAAGFDARLPKHLLGRLGEVLADVLEQRSSAVDDAARQAATE